VRANIWTRSERWIGAGSSGAWVFWTGARDEECWPFWERCLLPDRQRTVDVKNGSTSRGRPYAGGEMMLPAPAQHRPRFTELKGDCTR